MIDKTEAPLDSSHAFHMEERALAVALEKPKSSNDRSIVEQLKAKSAPMTARRVRHLADVTAKRHARGEFYSDPRVKAVNAMAPSKEQMDKDVRANYEAPSSALDVQKVHARIHFADVLAMNRSLLIHATSDVASEMRSMQVLEEQCASEWMGSLGDAALTKKSFSARRNALPPFRPASMPID